MAQKPPTRVAADQPAGGDDMARKPPTRSAVEQPAIGDDMVRKPPTRSAVEQPAGGDDMVRKAPTLSAAERPAGGDGGAVLHRLTLGAGAQAREIAALVRAGEGPPVVWLSGFRSHMRSTKAEALDAWAARAGRALVRFDYSAHGESGGVFEESTLSRWLEDALAVIGRFVTAPPVLVGSSMGGWIALLATRRLLEAEPRRSPAGLVLIAPAVDFTERLMWDQFPEAIKRAVMETGVYERPSVYSEDPYPITRELIEDGRNHLLFGAPIATGCPVHILQGMQDPDVPWEHAMELVEHLPGDSVSVTLVKDGDHRLSRPQDLGSLIAAIEGIVPAESSWD